MVRKIIINIQKKQIVQIIICLLCFSCGSTKKMKMHVNIEAYQLAKNFADSLINQKIDTVLIFTKGCSGCIKGMRYSVYVFWKAQDTLRMIRKFDNFFGIGSPVEIEDLTREFFNHESEIRKTELISRFWLSHYSYSSLKLIIEGHVHYEKEIPDYVRNDLNEDKRLMIWLQKIESTLYNLERRSQLMLMRR